METVCDTRTDARIAGVSLQLCPAPTFALSCAVWPRGRQRQPPRSPPRSSLLRHFWYAGDGSMLIVVPRGLLKRCARSLLCSVAGAHVRLLQPNSVGGGFQHAYSTPYSCDNPRSGVHSPSHLYQAKDVFCDSWDRSLSVAWK